MKFTEVTVHTTSEGSELVADILWRYSNYGVAISETQGVLDRVLAPFGITLPPAHA